VLIQFSRNSPSRRPVMGEVFFTDFRWQFSTPYTFLPFFFFSRFSVILLFLFPFEFLLKRISLVVVHSPPWALRRSFDFLPILAFLFECIPLDGAPQRSFCLLYSLQVFLLVVSFLSAPLFPPSLSYVTFLFYPPTFAAGRVVISFLPSSLLSHPFE